MNTKEAKNIIRNHCKSIGINSDANGYVKDNETNLIQIFNNWSEIKAELGSGQGSELKKDKNGVVKFNALHSSSALCVNNFAPFKANLESLLFLSYTKFTEVSFEKKLPTGISTPNLDFYLESEFEVIGFESKYLEFLDEKLPDNNNNLTQYKNRKNELSYMPDDYFALIEDYIKTSNKMHLDVAQLIKHTIGLKKKTISKYKFILNSMFVRPVLVYIYWQPNNWFNINEYCKHEEEIKSFKGKIDKYINFIPISYLEFWKYYESDKIYSDHIKNIKVRYDISF